MSMNRFASSFLIGALSAVASAQPPVLSNPRFLPGDDAIVPAAGDQRNVAVPKESGPVTLAVWEDDSTHLSGTSTLDGNMTDVFAARIDADGLRLDAVPIVVRAGLGDQTSPRVAWNGSHWLVAYVTHVSTATIYTTGVEAVRVAPDGTVLDVTPIDLGAVDPTGLDVASDGVDFVVAWSTDLLANRGIVAKRVSDAGVVLDAQPVELVANQTWGAWNFSLAYSANQFLVVWTTYVSNQNDNVLGRRIASSLAPLSGIFTIANSPDYDVQPAVTGNGESFLVAWERYNSCCVCGGGRVTVARVTASGQVLDPAGLAVQTYCAATTGRGISSAWDGSQWVVAFHDHDAAWAELKVHAARVSTTGQVLDPNGVVIDGTLKRQEDAVLSSRQGGGVLGFWTDARFSSGAISAADVFGARAMAGVNFLASECYSVATPRQHSGDTASLGDGAGAAIAYLSGKSGAQRVLLQRVDASGEPLDVAPVEVAPYSAAITNCSVAWNGSTYLVAWDELSASSAVFGTIKARRFGPGLAPLDAAPITVMPGLRPQVAAIGDVFCVAGLHIPGYPEFQFAFFRRLSAASGALLDAAPLQVGDNYARFVDVGAAGADFLLAWQRNYSHDDPHSDVGTAWVTPAGAVHHKQYIHTAANYYYVAPVVAWSGTSAFVAWQYGSTSNNAADVQGRSVSSNGALGPVKTIAAAVNSQFGAAIAWNGAEYVVAWSDRRTVPVYFDTRADLYANRLDATGAPLDGSGFAFVAEPSHDMHAFTAGLGGGAALLGGSTLRAGAAHPGFASMRIITRVENPNCGGLAYGYGAGCPAASGLVPKLAIEGCAAAGSSLTMTIADGTPAAPAALLLGTGAGSSPLSGACSLLISGLLPVSATFTLDASGFAAFGASLPQGTSGASFAMQAFVADSSPLGFRVTNGVFVAVE